MKPNTKDIILKVATSHFAKKGFHGASVREISKEAGVNIAAINYHFQSKEQLLFQVVKCGYEELREQINHIKTTNPLLFCQEVFELLLKRKNNAINTMLFFLLDECKIKEAFISEDEVYGPPGSKRFIEVLEKNKGKKIPPAKASWIAQTIFTIMFHKSLMLNSQYFTKSKMCHLLNMKQIKSNLKKTVQALLDQL